MFEKILVPLDATEVDKAVIPYVRQLAQAFNSEIILLRVAHYHTRDSREHEVGEAQEYAERLANELRSHGFRARALIAHGEIVEAIVAAAKDQNADLIAMAGHGHRHVVGWLLGSTIEDVRHQCDVPLLLVKGQPT